MRQRTGRRDTRRPRPHDGDVKRLFHAALSCFVLALIPAMIFGTTSA